MGSLRCFIRIVRRRALPPLRDDGGMADEEITDLGWIAPGCHGAPAEALARIRAICALMPDLHGAILAVLGTHQGLSREILAAAVRQCRADAQALEPKDVQALVTAVATGGREGFDAVLRARSKDKRRGGLGWVKE